MKEDYLLNNIATDDGSRLKRALDDLAQIQKLTGAKFSNIKVQLPVNNKDGLTQFQPSIINFDVKL